MNKLLITREDAVEALRKEIATVTFTKKDGTERVMKCTLQTEFLPIQEPKDENAVAKKVNEAVVAVFDIEAEAFRSFRLDTVKAFSTETMQAFDGKIFESINA